MFNSGNLSACTLEYVLQQGEDFLPADVNLFEIDLERLDSVQRWKQRNYTAYKNFVSYYSISANLDAYYQRTYNIPMSAALVRGRCTFLKYSWPNKETKILLLWGGYLICESNLFWLDHYPFLEPQKSIKVNTSSIKEYRLSENLSKLEYLPCSSSFTLSISHNNHFGHFIADDLPLLSLLNGPLSACVNDFSVFMPHRYEESIIECVRSYIDFFNKRSLTVGEVRCSAQQPGSLFMHDFENMHQLTSTSPFVQAFLVDKLIRRVRKQILCLDSRHTNSAKYLLLRGGGYSSRIANLEELLEYATRHSYSLIYPHRHSSKEISQMLSSAAHIITECGSTSLNAYLFSSNTTRITILLPRRLFEHTDEAMLYGGIPYILPFIHRSNLVLGETVAQDLIQTSDIVEYRIGDIF